MNTKKNYSRLLLALLLLVAGLAGAMRPQSVAAQSQPIPGSSLSWEYIPGTKTLSITGTGTMPDFTLTTRPPWENATNPIEKIVIEAGVTSVGAYAFRNSAVLTSVTLPAGVQTIGEEAFRNCAVLTSVTLPEGLTTIGKNAFFYCKALTNVKMPNSVTTMGEKAFNNCSALTSVTLSDKLTTIEKYAFEACIALPSVTIPSGVTTIEADAFNACIGLTSVTLPAGLQTLGERAFNGCDALTSIELPAALETIGEGALDARSLTEIKVQTGNTHFEAEGGVLYNKGKTTLLCYPRKKPGTTFAVPASVTTIEAYAFSVCPGLTSIELPKSLTTLKNGAFYYCSALKDVTVAWTDATSIPVIQSNVFNYLNLGKIKLHVPGGTKTTYLTKEVWKQFSIVEEPKGDLSTGLHWEYDAATRTLTISNPNPGTPKSMPDFADFDHQPWKDVREKIKTVVIETGVTSIGNEAFTGCEKLASITIPKSVTTIGKQAFAYCAALASISIPNSVTTIGSEAFSKCSALKDVTVAWETPIPTYADVFNHLTLDKIRLHVPAGKIGAYKAANVWEDFIVMSDRGDLAGGLQWQMDATYTLTIINPTPGSPKPMPDFNNWDEQPWASFRREIQAVTIEDGVSSVGETAFDGCMEMKSVTLPKSVTTIRTFAFSSCTKLASVTLPADAKLDTIGKDAFSGCPALTSISLPKSATTIEDRAFSGCEALTSVTLPADGKLQTIGVNAFGGCVKLKSITIPNSVTKIESGAFSRCKELTSVTLPDNAQFTKIESDAFQDCMALERITIPSHVTTIEANAFYGCTALASVTLPKSVTTIGWRAFQDCKALKDMTVAWTDTASIPNISLYVFQYTPPDTVKLSDIRLHVPTGTTAAYQSKAVWKEFTIVEQPLPPTPTPPTPPTPSTPSTPSAPFTPPATGKKISSITLNSSSRVINGEASFRITATINPGDATDKSLSWRSSDEKVATVKVIPTAEKRSGSSLRASAHPTVETAEVTIVGKGQAEIIVKALDGSGVQAVCSVDVRSTVGNALLPAARIYAAGGRVYLTLPASATVRIYTASGTLQRTMHAPAGTSSVALPRGVYVVKAGARTEKVFVD